MGEMFDNDEFVQLWRRGLRARKRGRVGCGLLVGAVVLLALIGLAQLLTKGHLW